MSILFFNPVAAINCRCTQWHEFALPLRVRDERNFVAMAVSSA
jgi:hypothetical protein